MSLIYEASGGKVGKGTLPAKDSEETQISFRDRRALLDSVTKLLGAQQEPDEEELSGIDSFKEHLRGGNDSRTDERGADTDEGSDA